MRGRGWIYTGMLLGFLWAQQPRYRLILDQQYYRAPANAPDSVDVYLIIWVHAPGMPADTLASSNFPFFYNMALDFAGARKIHERKFSPISKPNYYNPITYPFTPARVNVTVQRKVGYSGAGDTLVRLPSTPRDTILGLRVPVRACGPGQRSILVWDSASAAVLNSQLQSIKPRISPRWINDTIALCPTLSSYTWLIGLPTSTSTCVGRRESFVYAQALALGPDAAQPDSFVVFTQQISNGVIQSYPGLGSGGNFTLAFSQPDSYRVWVRFVEKKCGCFWDGPEYGIRVHPLPAVGQIIGPDTVYVGTSMGGAYSYSVSLGANFHQWVGRASGGAGHPTFTSGSTSTTDVQFSTPTGANCRPDTLWAVYQNANTCRDSVRKVVVVCPCSAAGIILAPTNRVCQSERVSLYVSGFVGDSLRWYIDTTGVFTPATMGRFPNSLNYQTPSLLRTARFRARVYQGLCYTETGIAVISVDTFRVQSVTLSLRAGTGTCEGDTVRFDTTVSRQAGNLDIDSLVLVVRNQAGDTAYYPDRLWYIPSGSGSYRAWVIVYGGDCGSVMSGAFTFSIQPRPPSLPIQGPDTIYVPLTGATYGYSLPTLLPGFSYGTVVWYHRIGGGGTSNPPNGSSTLVNFPAPPAVGRVDTLLSLFSIQGNPCPQFSAPKLIVVLPCRGVPPAQANPSVVCQGQRGTVEVPLPFAVDSLRWQYWDGSNWVDVPDGVGTGATATLYITPPLQAQATYRAKVYAGPCVAFSASVTISVSGVFLDRNLYSAQSPICAGDTARLKAGGSGVWITPNGQGAFTDTLAPEASYVSAPNDPATVRVCWAIRSQDLGACRELSKDTLCADITIQPAQASGSFRFNPPLPVVCPGEPVLLQGTITRGVRAEWQTSGSGSFSPSNTALSARYIPGPTDAGNKIYITFVVFGSCGKATYTDSLTVRPGVTPTILGPNQICENVSVTLSAANAGAFDSLRWWQGDVVAVQGGTATLLARTATYTPPSLSPGTYTFTLESSSGTCRGYDESQVEVLAAPRVSFEVSPRVTNLNNPTITFTNTSQGATTFLWNFGDPNQPSADSSRAQQVRFSYIRPGRYSVVLFGQNDLGCADVYICTECVVILPRKVFLPNAFSPNGDGKNDVFRVLPAEERTPFSRLEVYDRWGQLVFAGDNLLSWDGRSSDGKPLDAGTYTYKAFILVPDEGLLTHTGVVHLVR